MRCIVDVEIKLSIVCSSTHFACNPAANLSEHLDAGDPISVSLPQSEHYSVKIKEEPVEDSSHPVEGTLHPEDDSFHPVEDTFQPEDDPYDDYEGTFRNNDEHDTVRPTMAYDYNTVRIKEEEVETTVDNYSYEEDHKDPTLTLRAAEDDATYQHDEYDTHENPSNREHDTYEGPGNTEHNIHERPGNREHDDEMQETQRNDDNVNDTEEPVPETIGELEELESLEKLDNISNLFDDWLTTNQNIAMQKRQEKQKQKEEQHKRELLEKQQQENERVKRIRLEKEQLEKKQAEERVRVQQELEEERLRTQQWREQEERERLENDAHMEEEHNEEAVPSMDEDRTTANLREAFAMDDQGDTMDVDDAPPVNNRQTTVEPDGEERFSKVVFAPLVVKPRPRSLPTPIFRSSGVNFKKFVKVGLFFNIKFLSLMLLL